VAALHEKVESACAEVGRDPTAIERTVAVMVRLPGGAGRTMGDTSVAETAPALEGSLEAMAEEMRAYARAGIAEVQLVLDPIDRPSIERFAAVLRLLDAG